MDMLSFKSLFTKCSTAMDEKDYPKIQLTVGAITEMVHIFLVLYFAQH